MNIATAQKQPPGAFCEKVVLQNSQKNICVIVSFLREKNDSGTGLFSLNSAKYLRTLFFTERIRASASDCRNLANLDFQHGFHVRLVTSILLSHEKIKIS